MLQLLSRFRHSEEGSVLPLIGLASFVLIGAMGFAIDLGRAQLVQAKLLNSADAAALAVGARLSTVDLNAEANKFVTANFPAGYAQATVTSVVATADSTNTVITVVAKATVPTTLMQLLGIKKVDVSVTSQVTRQTTGLELALVLDNTGSMAGDMTDLKAAANSLVDTLYGSNNSAPNLYVGLVPFSQTVNVGTSHSSWMVANSVSGKNWGATSWGGCVDAQYSTNNDITDIAPTTEATRLQPFYWGDESNNDWITTSSKPYTTVKNGVYYNIYDYNTYSIGPNAYCPSAMTPMTPTKSKVVAGINAMVARGATHVGLGADWGWRMLSPKWRTYWGGDMNSNNLPLDYGTPKMNKAMVLMTDGENTFASTTRTAYGKLSDYGVTEDVAVAQLDIRLTTVCTAMKNAGIIVYTIAFRDPGANVETLLKNCASNPDYYFDSPTSTELATAFKTIGDSLSNLRVSM